MEFRRVLFRSKCAPGSCPQRPSERAFAQLDPTMSRRITHPASLTRIRVRICTYRTIRSPLQSSAALAVPRPLNRVKTVRPAAIAQPPPPSAATRKRTASKLQLQDRRRLPPALIHGTHRPPPTLTRST